VREGEPSSETDPTRGGVQPSSEADPARGGAQPSREADLARGGVQPSSEADLARGGVPLCRPGGPRGATRTVIVSCTCLGL
jgi:hypothetical protein